MSKKEPSEGQSEVCLVFPHQLFPAHEMLNDGQVIFLVEEHLFFRQYAFHRHKLLFQRASMKAYEGRLKSSGKNVRYIDSQSELCDVRNLIDHLSEDGVGTIHFIDPTDNWLSTRIRSSANRNQIKLVEYDSPLFINSLDGLDYFQNEKKKLFQTSFYKQQRKKWSIMIDQDQEPEGGNWTYDVDNRKKYPSDQSPPTVEYPSSDELFTEAREYVEQHFPKNPGALPETPLYPFTRETALKWMDQFLEQRLTDFGKYQDAMVAGELLLNHSLMSPLLNTGLIAPMEFIEAVLEYTEDHPDAVPINSTEGLIRQVLGWREFLRGIYEFYGSKERTRNFWGFDRKIPQSFYSGETGIEPVDLAIRKVLDTGYCHHIERLMVLGNFMLLCEFDPDEVYRWFMELFIDSYDWVMVPNVYGMSQFADGGLFATKPYISGSNYLRKMGDFNSGSWEDIWDGLFWRFIKVNREFFSKNPRLKMMVVNLDRMSDKKQQRLLQTAQDFLDELN